MKQHKLLWISGIALLFCLTSAVFASNITAVDADVRPDWNNFGKAIWITVLVTLPSFSIFLVTVIAAATKARKK